MAVKKFTQKQNQQNRASTVNQGKTPLTGKIPASSPVVSQPTGKTDTGISGGGTFLATHQATQPQKIEGNNFNAIYNPTATQKTDANGGMPTSINSKVDTTIPAGGTFLETHQPDHSKVDTAIPEGGTFLETHQWDHLKPRLNETPSEKTARYNNILGAFLDNPVKATNDLFDTLLGDRVHKRNFQNYYLDQYNDSDVRPYSNPNFAYDTSGNGATPYVPNVDSDVRPYSNPNFAYDTSGNGATPYVPNVSGGQKIDARGLGYTIRELLAGSGNESDGRSTASGSSGSRGIGGTGAYENAYDLNSLYDLLNARLNEANNQYSSLMDSLLGAYDANNANLDDYYAAILEALGANYADTESLLRSRLSQDQQALEDDRRRAMQEAYISRMLAEKRLGDQLDAYGLTGGASESVMANLLNTYLNNRNEVETKTQNSLSDLLQNYLSNLNTARGNYNTGLMNAAQNRMNARQQLANNLASSQADAANYLANARGGAYEDLFNTLARLYT